MTRRLFVTGAALAAFEAAAAAWNALGKDAKFGFSWGLEKVRGSTLNVGSIKWTVRTAEAP